MTDGQTDVRQHNCLMHPHRGGHNNSYVRRYLNLSVAGDELDAMRWGVPVRRTGVTEASFLKLRSTTFDDFGGPKIMSTAVFHD